MEGEPTPEYLTEQDQDGMTLSHRHFSPDATAPFGLYRYLNRIEHR